MNAATDVRPEVTAFVAAVRERLADLTDEEREELLGGLEADLSEQLADGGVLVLSDPGQYAEELRAAAGLPEQRRRRRGPHLPQVPTRERVAGWPDALRRRWCALTERHEATRRAWAMLEVLRPAWWVLRAWVAVTLLDQSSGTWEYVTIVPTLGVSGLGAAVLLGAVVLSVLMGQGRLWPGSGPDRGFVARVVLCGLNVLAVLAPFSFAVADGSVSHYYGGDDYSVGYHDGRSTVPRDGLRLDGHVVRNVYPYDADGQPITDGVQLFDQNGQPLPVGADQAIGRRAQRQVTCPWVNGTASLFNVFPLQQREQRRGTCLEDVGTVGPRAFQEPPLAHVPPVTLPGTPADAPEVRQPARR